MMTLLFPGGGIRRQLRVFSRRSLATPVRHTSSTHRLFKHALLKAAIRSEQTVTFNSFAPTLCHFIFEKTDVCIEPSLMKAQY